VVPGVMRWPRRSLAPRDMAGLLRQIDRWKAEAQRAGRTVHRTVLAYEAGRDGFWIARYLLAQGIEVQVMHPASIPVERRGRRVKTDRIDLDLLLRTLLAWLRGEPRVCTMARIPSEADEDMRRPERERERLVSERIALENRMENLLCLQGVTGFKPGLKKAAMAREPDRAVQQIQMLARLFGLGLATATGLTREVFCRSFADRKAIAGFVGLTGTPFNSGGSEREQGISKNGNPRVRRILLQLARRWLRFQPDSALSCWFVERTAGAKGRIRKIMVVALARKLLVALWRYVETGELPAGARFAGA